MNQIIERLQEAELRIGKAKGILVNDNATVQGRKSALQHLEMARAQIQLVEQGVEESLP